jgi:hypothetical protein
MLLTNLLRMDGLKRGWGILLLPVLLEALEGFCCFLFFWRHLWEFVASCSFGGTWAILLLSGSFGSTFWETIFLVEGYLLFVFLSFGSFG